MISLARILLEADRGVIPLQLLQLLRAPGLMVLLIRVFIDWLIALLQVLLVRLT